MELDRAVDAIMQLLRDDRALIGDGPALRACLTGLDDDAQRAIAHHARAIWKHEVTTRGDVDRALGAALVARALHGALGDDEAAMRAGYDFLQTRFMVADDVAAYASARHQLGALGARAALAGVLDLAFCAATTAADCTYFALGACGPGAERAAILDALVDDLMVACDALRRCPTCRASRPADFERFVSLASAAYEAIETVDADPATVTAWRPDEASTESLATRLRGLAASIEALVPDDFTFSDGAPARSAQAAGTLSRLSAQHGDPASARARLRASLRDG